MLTGKQAGPGGRPRPPQAQQVAAVLQAAAPVTAVAVVVPQGLAGAVPAHHQAAAVEASHNAGPLERQWSSQRIGMAACQQRQNRFLYLSASQLNLPTAMGAAKRSTSV